MEIEWPQPPQYGAGPIQLCVPAWAYDDRYLGQPVVPHIVTGPYHLVRNPDFLAQYGIQVILCIRDPSEMRFLRERDLGGIAFHFLDVPTDVHRANIIPQFTQATAILAQLVAERRNVLVCCSDGIDKSASFVAAYLMDTYGLRALDAITFVQNHRYCATPSANGYRIKLLEYEPICAARAATAAAGPAAQDRRLRRPAEGDPEDDCAQGLATDVTGRRIPVPKKRAK
ncbi:hypothetical protein H4R18_001870 [Coemansia javaensis]|uniref:Tyrosine specific protein phosphatases domain-containing protein n=1 Tax=Coemansia javaensis TaxID=2761396 RepID=A0A9W8LJL0_9FUNG|nr:hypothetical protein H4R18_001870 [Coemansia javaensis]